MSSILNNAYPKVQMSQYMWSQLLIIYGSLFQVLEVLTALSFKKGLKRAIIWQLNFDLGSFK